MINLGMRVSTGLSCKKGTIIDVHTCTLRNTPIRWPENEIGRIMIAYWYVVCEEANYHPDPNQFQSWDRGIHVVQIFDNNIDKRRDALFQA